MGGGHREIFRQEVVEHSSSKWGNEKIQDRLERAGKRKSNTKEAGRGGEINNPKDG